MCLPIVVPKLTAHRRDFEETKYIILLIKDNELLEKYYDIWAKSAILLKTKIKSYEEEINTNFHNDKMPKKLLIVFVYQWY